jgi:hypothetical protein
MVGRSKRHREYWSGQRLVTVASRRSRRSARGARRTGCARGTGGARRTSFPGGAGRACSAGIARHRRLLVVVMAHVMLLRHRRRFSRGSFRRRSFSRWSPSRRCARSRRLLRPHCRNHQGAGEERRTQDRQSPLHTNFSFILLSLGGSALQAAYPIPLPLPCHLKT